MPYTSVELIQIIVAITVGLTSIIGAIVAGVAAVRAGRVEKQQQVISAKQTLLSDKVDVVELQTNSHLVRLEKRLSERDLELAKQYMAQIVAQEAARVELAHQEALRVALATPVPETPVPPVVESAGAVVVESAEEVTIVPTPGAAPRKA